MTGLTKRFNKIKVQFDNEVIMEQRLMAVWRYDMPPYYNVGEIDRFIIDGRVVPKGYGNSCFEPVKIAPLDELKIRELKKMKADYSDDVAELCSSYKHKAELLFGIHSTTDKSTI